MADRIFLAALALYVFVLPISGTTALRNGTFALLLATTAWQAIRGGLRLDLPLMRPWTAYAAVALVSLLYAANPGYSLSEIKVEVGYCFAILVIAASWIRTGDRLLQLVWLLAPGNLLFLAVPAVKALAQGKEVLHAWHSSVGANATVMATVLPWIVVLAIRTSAEYRHRATLLLALLFIANLGALALTLNRQGWIALATSLAVASVLAGRAFWTRRRLFLAGGGALVFMALAAFQFQLRAQGIAGAPTSSALDASKQAVHQDLRWALWRFSLERIAERPMTGGGFGREAFDELYRDYRLQTNSQLWHAHNMVINKGVQMGIPGIASFLALWVALVISCAKGLHIPALRPWAIAALAMITGVFVRNMVDDFFIRDHALLFWLLSGAYLGALHQAMSGDQDPNDAATS